MKIKILGLHCKHLYPKWMQVLFIVASLTSGLWMLSCLADLAIDRHRSSLNQAIENTLNIQVSIQDISFNILSGIELDNVFVKSIHHHELPIPLHIKKIRIPIRPSFDLYPHPLLRLGKIIVYEPSIHIRPSYPDLYYLWNLVKPLTIQRYSIGPYQFEVAFSASELSKGSIHILQDSPSPHTESISLEDLNLVVKKHWFIGDQFHVRTSIPNLSDAVLESHGYIKHSGQSFESRLHINAHNAIRPYLAKYMNLHDVLLKDQFTALAHLKMNSNKQANLKLKLIPPKPDDLSNIRLFYLYHLVNHFQLDVDANLSNPDTIELDLETDLARIHLTGNAQYTPNNKTNEFLMNLRSKNFSMARMHFLLPQSKITSGRGQIALSARIKNNRILPSLVFKLDDFSGLLGPKEISADHWSLTTKLTKNKWIIPKAKGFLMNIPLDLSFEFRRMKNPSLTLKGSSTQGNSKHRFRGMAKAFDNGWNLKTQYAHPVLSKDQSPERWSLTVNRLRTPTLSFIELDQVLEEGLFIKMPQIELNHVLGNTQKKLIINNTNAMLEIRSGEFHYSVHDAELLDGSMSFRGFLDTNMIPDPLIEAALDLNSINVNQLQDFIQRDLKLTGSISFNGLLKKFSNAYEISGDVHANQGTLKNISALDSIYETLRLKPDQGLDFDALNGNIRMTQVGFELNRLHLDTGEFKISSNLKSIYDQIDGHVHFHFSRDFVKQSPDLSWIRFFDPNQESIVFDFKITGSMEHPRIQWLDGELKQTLERSMPSWLQSHFSEKIQKRLSSRRK